MQKDTGNVIISVKGSGENKDGECTWACVIDCVATQNNEENKGPFRMEMYAILNALRVAKTLSVPAEIRTNNEKIALICQKMHTGKGYEARENLDLWSIIEKEIKTLESDALKLEFIYKSEKDEQLERAEELIRNNKNK